LRTTTIKSKIHIKEDIHDGRMNEQATIIRREEKRN
jgi:hypothetical protein